MEMSSEPEEEYAEDEEVVEEEIEVFYRPGQEYVRKRK